MSRIRRSGSGSTDNNRLVAAADTAGDETFGDEMWYDKAGNLVYDAKNRMARAVQLEQLLLLGSSFAAHAA